MEQEPGRSACLLLIFFVVVFVADFLFVAIDPVPPLLADDWAIHAELVWGQTRSPATRIREILLMSWEGRPLRALEYALQVGAYRAFGLVGGFLLQASILALSALAFARILSRRLPRGYDLLGGLIFLLHPGDTTHAWLATMMAKLALLYTLLAILAFRRDRNLLAGLLLLAGFLSYELSPFAFALAPWAADGMSRRSLRRGLTVFGGALVLYVLWRGLVFEAIAPDIRGALTATEGDGQGAALMRWLRSLATVLPVMILPPFARSASVMEGAMLLLGAASPLLIFFGLKARRAPEPETGANRAAARAVAAGVIATLSGAALGFAASPSTDPGIGSRHLIAALPGAALLFTALLAALSSKLARGSLTRFAIPLLPAALLAVGASGRWAIQTDYRDAGREQRAELKVMITDLGALPPHCLVIIRHPLANWNKSARDLRAATPLVTGFGHEIEAILGLVYDRSIVGVALESENDLSRMQLATASQILAETTPFHAVVAYDLLDHSIAWVKRPPLDAAEESIAPQGPAWAYLGR